MYTRLTLDTRRVTFETSDDATRLDHEWIWHMLSNEVYWGRWRTRSDVETQVGNAWRVIGAYDKETGAQIGFARAVSDGVAFGYLADVMVDPSRRGESIGKAIVRHMIDDGPGADFRWTLFTADAHGLYAQYGFAAADETAMVRAPKH